MTEIEYDMELDMDIRCQIREMDDFLSYLDQDVGLDTCQDGQVLCSYGGSIHLYCLSEPQLIDILKYLADTQYRHHDIKIIHIANNVGNEWYPNYDEYKSSDYVLYGVDKVCIIDTKQTDKNKIFHRLIESLHKNEDD